MFLVAAKIPAWVKVKAGMGGFCSPVKLGTKFGVFFSQIALLSVGWRG